MKRRIKRFFCSLLIGALLLIGAWYLVLAPKLETFSEGENRFLAGFPKLTISALKDGSFASDFEKWLLDQFVARDSALDFSTWLKDFGSIASFEDALAIMGRDDDALTDNLDEDSLMDMISGIVGSSGDIDLEDFTLPENLDDEALMDYINGLLNPSGSTESTQDSTTEPKLSIEDYPELLAIKSSSGGKLTTHKRHKRTYAVALISVLNRVAALLPEDGQLMFTMVPQSNLANAFLATENREYFTSEAEEMIDAFSADNVHGFSTAEILSDSLVRGDYVYFRSDMHWTPEGAYLVYCEMVKAAGLTPTPWEDFHIETEENFLGTYYRDNPSNYMKENPDTLTLVTPNFPLEWRRITGKDTYKVIPLLDMDAKESDRYSIYLGGSAGPWTYAECDNGKTENCLVITDSFGLPFVPMVSTNYGQVHYLDTRYYDKSTVGYTVKEMMQQYNITDVYVIVGDLHSYGSSFLTYDLPDQLGD